MLSTSSPPPFIPTKLPSLGGLKVFYGELYNEVIKEMESPAVRLAVASYFGNFVKWATLFEITEAARLPAKDFYALLEESVPWKANHVAHLMMALNGTVSGREVVQRISRVTGLPVLSPLSAPSMYDTRVMFPDGYIECLENTAVRRGREERARYCT